MVDPIEITTKRLVLRQWKSEDWELFAYLNANPQVMAFFPNPLSRQESDALVQRFQNQISDRGWGFWAVEVRGFGDFIGFVGLNIPSYELPCTPCVEIGWRLSDKYWGKGYATEAAQSALEFGFLQLDLSEIYSFTSVLNQRSIKVMQRLKMHDTGKYFDHPLVPDGNRLQKHCLFRLTRKDWQYKSV